jgi:hypothetical protein
VLGAILALVVIGLPGGIMGAFDSLRQCIDRQQRA